MIDLTQLMLFGNLRKFVDYRVALTPLRQHYYDLIDLEECFSISYFTGESDVQKELKNQIINVGITIGEMRW